MDFLADIFLGAGALAAAFYCLVLSRRLSRLKGLDQDLGSAITILSKQVDEMTGVLSQAQVAANNSSTELADTTERAENIAGRLEILIAAVHDIDEQKKPDFDATPENEELPSEDANVFVRNPSRVMGAA